MRELDRVSSTAGVLGPSNRYAQVDAARIPVRIANNALIILATKTTITIKSNVHLHLHTEYSIVDSTVRIPSLMQHCASGGMPAVALTDQGNIFGLVKFYRKALQSGVKPIVGADVRVVDPADEHRSDSIVLLCQNLVGYRNLTRLVTRSWLEGQHRGVPRVERHSYDVLS